MTCVNEKGVFASMISKRNFALITAMMLVVLFMFQATGVAKDRWNDAEKNEYAEQNRTNLSQKDAFSPEKSRGETVVKIESNSDSTLGSESEIGFEAMSQVTNDHKRKVLFVGDRTGSAVAETVYQWCTYSKREIAWMSSVSMCQSYLDEAEIILIDSNYLQLATDVQRLNQMADQGMNLIFCNLPEVEVLSAYPEFQKLVGITGVAANEVELLGIHLFAGLIVGGERIYMVEKPEEERLQDMELTVPWYITLNGTKAYMVGMLENMGDKEGQTRNEYAPNLIWRNSSGGSGQVFVVNGDFIEDQSGIGILEGMVCDLYPCEAYPIINAQSLSIANFPSFTMENSAKMQELYSRELPVLYRDVIWQGISTVTERNRQKITALMAPQYDYTDGLEPSGETFTYFARLFNEKRTEIGLSLDQISDMPLTEKVKKDLAFLNTNLPDYEYRAAYAPEYNDEIAGVLEKGDQLDSVTTVLTGMENDQPLVSFAGGCTLQKTTSDAFHHSYTENFRMRCVESALGYSAILMDMERVAYPQTSEDGWEKLNEEFASNVLTYWKDYESFDKVTLSQSDVRIRRFLCLDYDMWREGDAFNIAIKNFEQEAFFILRTHGESPKEILGGEFVELEDDIYMISCRNPWVRITLEPDEVLRYQ